MRKSLQIRQAIGQATDQLEALIDDATAFAVKEAEITALRDQLSRAERAEAATSALARPVAETGAEAEPAAGVRHVTPGNLGGQLLDLNPRLSRFADGEIPDFGGYVRQVRETRGFTPSPSTHFRNFGEQLQAIFNYSMSRGASVDSRLVRAPTGASEIDPTGGGFLVQTDFQEAIFLLAHDLGEFMGRVNKIPISANSNGLKIPAVDESSRVTGSRFGGVASYWVAEGTTVATSKPKFRLVEFDLKKLFSVMYTTDELLQDSTALMTIAGLAFSEEVMFMTEDAIFEGSGAGQPLGIMNAPAKVTVAKDVGQATATISKANIDNMWSRCWARSRKNAVWFINQDAEPQLQALNGPVGTAGDLVYMPPGGLSAAPYATLKGRPVVAVEYCNTLGTEGDILLADLSQYTLVDKGGVQAATSMHIAFLTDEMAFRLTYRVDGKPMWHVPLTPFKGSNTKSPFITLATRP